MFEKYANGGIKYHTPINNKKGFTLIELLAVIVILAIIALIAVPIVLNIIEKARKGAVKTSTLNYIKAVETYLVASKLDKGALELKKNNSYNCTKNTIIEDKNYLPINDLVELKGYKPTGSKDKITIDENYQVSMGELTINGYTVSIKDKEITSIVKGAKIDVEKIELNYTEQTMEKGSTFELKPTFTPKDASDQRVTYSSSDENIVTVDELGVVTAKKNGIAKIIVTSKDDTSKKVECNITVITSATGVSIEPTSKEINIGGTVQLVGTIEPGDVTTNALTWTSSNESIAHVDENGLVTGMSAGSATVTAKTVNGKTATATITVKDHVGIPTKTYSVNQAVTYQGISFQVVKDNGDTVTLVTSSDVGTGQFGSNTTFANSTAYNYVNTTWVNNNSGIKSEIESGGIITDSTTNSKVRLLTTSEASGKTNGTGNAFWTMTASGSNMYYAKSNGSTSYSYVSGTSLTSASTVASPTSTTGRVDDTYTSQTSTSLKVKHSGFCTTSEENRGCTTDDHEIGERPIVMCKCPKTTTTYSLTNTNTKPIGYRPVITVKKK